MERFTAHQACKFTGCSPRQLRYWDEIGLVTPSVQSTGGRPGVPRLYSFRDLIALRVVRSLLGGGMSLRVRRAWDYLNRRAGLDRHLSSEARHRRGQHLQDLPARWGGPRRPSGGPARVLRRHRRHRLERRLGRGGVPQRSRSSSERCARQLPTSPRRLTAAEAASWKPGSMSPEQLAGRPRSRRSAVAEPPPGRRRIVPADPIPRIRRPGRDRRQPLGSPFEVREPARNRSPYSRIVSPADRPRPRSAARAVNTS